MTAPQPQLQPQLSSQFLAFALLPSRSLHPSRRAALWPAHAALLATASPGVQRSIERLESTELLAQLPPHALPDPQAHALPLAMMAAEALARVQRRAGLVLFGGWLRRTIARALVLQMQESLGVQDLDWARQRAAALHPGLSDAALAPWLQAQALNACVDFLGAALLSQAWSDSDAALRQRGDWRLPQAATTATARASSGLTPEAACALGLHILQTLEAP